MSESGWVVFLMPWVSIFLVSIFVSIENLDVRPVGAAIIIFLWQWLILFSGGVI